VGAEGFEPPTLAL